MRPLAFTKMQGLGNDFVLFDGPIELSPDDIARLCHRRFGVGADGVLVVTSGDPIRMAYWNADGSAAEMCGNGLRCVARYAVDQGLVSTPEFTVETPAGPRRVKVLEGLIEAEMGRPRIAGQRTIGGLEFTLVDIGNPHAVTVVSDPQAADVEGVGRRLQTDFEDGVNVEFIAVRNGAVDMRVFERGVGETLACGTGMAAVGAMTSELMELPAPIEVNVPGGTASVELRDGVAWLRGPASYSFRGSVEAH